MGDRRDYYFRQKVTEAELDAGFNGLEQADFNLSIDHDLVGIVTGMGVSEKSGTPDLTVDVAGPGAAYSKQGERISFSSLQNVDLSVDDGSVSTAVATPGNSRVVSLFIEFDRLLSDPRIDGNSATVFFQRDESFNFSVVAGAEATTGTEVPPALDPNKILLADITLDFGQTQILNADVGITRREDAFRLTGTVPIVAGTPLEAVTALLAGLNNHIDGIANKHPGADLTYAGSPNWHTGLPLTGPPADVEAGIDQIVTDLADVTGNGGGDRVGIAGGAATWADATTLAAGSVFDQIQSLVSSLGAVGGAAKVGNVAAGNVAAADVQAAINELDTEKAGLALANVFTALQTLSGAGSFADFVSLANAATPDPMIRDTSRSITSTQFKFVAEFSHGLSSLTRWYVDGQGGIVITDNARWDNTANLWVSDVAGTAHKLDYHFGNLLGEKRNGIVGAGETWNDSAGWTVSTGFQLQTEPAGAGATTPEGALFLRDGFVQLAIGAAGDGTNLPNGTVPVGNTLYAKNLVKSWMKLLGFSKDEEFGHTSAVTNSAGAAVLSFNALTASAFNQAIAGLCDGTSATTAKFLTADNYATNGVTIRAWRWSGTAIVQEDLTSDDWGVIRCATI